MIRRSHSWLAALAGALLLAAPALAQEGDAPPAGAAAPAPEAAAPVQDEVRLVGGELLHGEVLYLRLGKLKLKSAALDEVEMDWAKVESFTSGRSHDYLFNDGTALVGPARIDKAQVVIQTAQGERVMPLAELATINPAPPKTERDFWSFKLTLTYTQTFGNTRTKTFAGFGMVKRDDGTHRVTLSGISVYGFAAGVETAKSHRADLQYDVQVTERFYVTPFVGQLYYDKFQNIALRYRIGAGVGYFILKQDDVEWQAEVGFSYTETKFRRVVPPTRDKRYETSARLATKATWKINEHLSFYGFYECYVGTNDVQDTAHHLEAILSFKYDIWSLDVGVIYDRLERPERRASDGKIPSQDDAKMFIGLGISI